MNITGILIQAYPVDCQRVRDRLLRLPGVEVHSIDPRGRIITTVEDTDEVPTSVVINQIEGIEGILSATLVYHYFEPEQLSGETHETHSS